MDSLATDTVVRLEGVEKRYRRGTETVTALDGVDLELRRGEFTAIMGPSGSGKSTLMHLVAGLDQASSGRIWLGGTELGGLDDDALTLVRRRRIGFVFQSFNLVPELDLEANVLLPFQLDRRPPTPEHRAEIDELLLRLGLGDRLRHRPAELSGGQQQRVAIARAIATRPEIIVADEPTGSLDSRASRAVLALLREAVDLHGRTVLMVTHDPLAASRADRVVFLADGRVVADERDLDAARIAERVLALDGAV